MRKHAYSFIAAAVSAACLASGAAYALPSTKVAPADLGETTNLMGSQQIEVTVILKMRNEGKVEDLIRSLHTPGSPNYHQFLTSAQFKAQFAPLPDAVARVTKHFQAAGLTVHQESATALKISGSTRAVQAAFDVQLRSYEGFSQSKAYRFYMPTSNPQIAPAIAADVQSVIGLDSRPRFHPNLKHSIETKSAGQIKPLAAANSSGNSNVSGQWTVLDYAKYYNVNPLYQKGLDGTGTHIGIVTLASFTPQDANEYWKGIGLKYLNRRIHEIHVDGGSGPPSDEAGSSETTLDVEQAGGLAPQAKVVVYEAPNTSQGFLDGFVKAVEDNKCETISSSWGIWEFFDLPSESGPVTDPYTGHEVSLMKAYGEVFTQAALQGQSVYIATGDSGAFETASEVPPPSWPLPKNSVVYSVGDPAVSQYVTAIGGTTLPGKQVFQIGKTEKVTINVPTEMAWSWTYLQPLCDALGLDPLSCGTFSVGGGGGVSSYVPLPFYQVFIPGILATEPGQKLLDYSVSPPQLIGKLPAYFYGRNVPDVSSNADPETGYQIWYTSDVDGFEVLTFYGGTSFGAPQFNGVTALYVQGIGRVGNVNFALYDLARFGAGYKGGTKAPLRDITAGDNWGYEAHGGYDQTTGVGVPNFSNLYKALQ